MIKVIQNMNFKIDNLQYCNWSRKIFEYNRSAELDAVHVTIVYHEDYHELLEEIKKWEILFSENSDLIFLGRDYKDIDCLLYTSPSPRDATLSRMPSSA